MKKLKTRLFSDLKKNEIRLIRLGLLCYKANEARSLAEYYESGLTNTEEINSFDEGTVLANFNWPNELYWELWRAVGEREKHRKYFIYARIASKSETDIHPKSIQNQIDYLLEYAKKEKLKVVGTYSDIGSGMSLNRPGFTKMLKKLKAGEANAILVTDRTRLTRDRIKNLKLNALFFTEDIKVEVAKGN